MNEGDESPRLIDPIGQGEALRGDRQNVSVSVGPRGGLETPLCGLVELSQPGIRLVKELNRSV